MEKSEGAWILNMLTIKGVLALETVEMMRLTTDCTKWESLVRSHLKQNAVPPKDTDPIELRLMYENAGKCFSFLSCANISKFPKKHEKSQLFDRRLVEASTLLI